MKILDQLRNRSPQGSGDAEPTEGASADEAQLPISGYDGLKSKQITEQLSQLSQVELADVETYERAHEDRPVVLNKLRYMRGREPLPGYDTLSPDQITEALADADAETGKAVRDYERKFAHRPQVMEEAARLLPLAPASARENRAEKERTARLAAASRSAPSGSV